MEKYPETLEENGIGDSPAVQVKETQPLKVRSSNSQRLDMQEQSKNRKEKESQETGQFPGKENQLETDRKKKRKRVYKQVSKKGDPADKASLTNISEIPQTREDQKNVKDTGNANLQPGDPADKASLTNISEIPQTKEDQKNVKDTGNANLQPKRNSNPNTKPQVIIFAFKKYEGYCRVEDHELVIDYAKKYLMRYSQNHVSQQDAEKFVEKYVKSENFILYSHKRNAIINPYVPCNALVEKEKIEIVPKWKKSTPQHSNYEVCEEGTFFKVKCKGQNDGGATRKILQDEIYNWEDKPLAVYGLKHQTIEEAIRNDKRFKFVNFSLKNPNETPLTEKDVPLSFLEAAVVYTVQVTSEQKSDPKVTKTEGSQSFAKKAKGSQNVDDITPEVSQTLSHEPNEQVPEMPESYRTPTSTKFSNDYNGLSKKFGGKKLREALMRDHIRYSKPMTAETLKLLTEHLKSVAMIKCTVGNSITLGTFFLLTESLGLTCFHVVEPLLDPNPGLESKRSLSVIFNYDKESDKGLECRAKIEHYHKAFDFAFLRVSAPNSVKSLLNYVAPPPKDGAVNIIGHASGEPKKLDPICTVNFSERARNIADNILSDPSYIHVLTEYNFRIMACPELVTYETYLYGGASGAPVFNEHGELTAMHTGGFLAQTHLKKKSIIEYGRNIIDILICGVSKLEDLRSKFRETRKGNKSLNDYLENYTCPGGHSESMQPYIREYLECLKEESPQEQNPDDSGIAMDTS